MSTERAARFVEDAYRLTDLGWSLIRLDGKIPKGKDWQHTDPLRDPHQAAGMWAEWGKRWNMGVVHLVDPRTGALLAPIYPLDKLENADGRRRVLEPTIIAEAPPAEPSSDGMAPLLRKLLAQYASTGIPPAYLPKPPETETKKEERA